MPDLLLENKHSYPVAGVDEVGRGPWAGPVVAAACIIPPSFPQEILIQLADSKKLSAKKREKLAPLIIQYAITSTCEASVEEIDELNILNATFLAMRRAIASLSLKPNFILVDGNHPIRELTLPQQNVIKGDDISVSIAAASIIAKVYRDELMARLAHEYPFYGWESNAGYGTKVHQQGLALHGITKHHRKSFKPIQKIITKG
ncbi:MAG: ribonuclease HII [Alphaproteobacteria bacterium]